MHRLTDRPAMTIAVDLGRKANKQTNKQFRQEQSRYFVFMAAQCSSISQYVCTYGELSI